MVGPAAKCEAVAHLQAVTGLSERLACSFADTDRKMIRYRSCRLPEMELRATAVGAQAPILVEARPNARWSLDFVQDQFACGRRFRVLNIVDNDPRMPGHHP